MTNDPIWVMPVPADVPRELPLMANAIWLADPVVLDAADAECIHLLALHTCTLCMDSLTGRPTDADERAAWAGRNKRTRKVPTNGVIRPADPSEWTYDEWMLPEHRAHRATILKGLRANERDRYNGTTCVSSTGVHVPKDHSIKPINRTKR